MEYVEALRDTKQIDAIKRYLKKHSERDYVLFVMGINTGLKITELLEIKVGNVMDANGNFHEFYTLPLKDGAQEIYLNSKVKRAVLPYVLSHDLQPDDYLYQSPKTKKPITRQQAYRIIHQAAEEVGIPGKIGTNSMRKTFGFHAYKRGVAISLLQKHFHHSSRSETLKYIGISKEDNLKAKIDVNL
ncbi:tyrosine-type recombinase/integrase [Caldibacillus lycopersici]|uniref:Tyrosine-type recombinase/integrase n=1 Tax=Perspicuibacillus lycopersici TaxID=1325689 RepID=A0AAE3IQR6_9BACI|nr:tyrosine-type recombinase/integrase [Perspicuibacillus lycopersici]MCU9612691.1 tyrosine-type recombinase/integrase [Perspicuibacillus lycopersici]